MNDKIDFQEARCKLCGHLMPPGEEMFFYHGLSGPCPGPPLLKEEKKLINLTENQIRTIKCAYADLVGSLQSRNSIDIEGHDWKSHRETIHELEVFFSEFITPVENLLEDWDSED